MQFCVENLEECPSGEEKPEAVYLVEEVTCIDLWLLAGGGLVVVDYKW
jgi:hypothetical protein